jgi:hypothetical protein
LFVCELHRLLSRFFCPDCLLESLLCLQSQQLITEILSLQKEVSYLEQRAHSLYHRLLNQKLSVQLSTHHCGTDCSSLGAQEPAMIMNVQSSDLMAKSTAEQRQTPFPPRMPQNQYCIGSVATKGFRAPHSASIDVSQFKQLQPGSLLAPQNGVQPPHASFTPSVSFPQSSKFCLYCMSRVSIIDLFWHPFHEIR